MKHDHMQHDIAESFDFILSIPFFLACLVYWLAGTRSSRKYRKWSLYRTVCWVLGTFCTAAAVIGPLAKYAHLNFMGHMLVHILLGMLAPIFLIFSAPMTLFLRTISITSARNFGRLLRSWPLRLLTDPLVAALLNSGGLWVLYTTDLFQIMSTNFFVFFLVHLHIFLAGYLFTSSIIYVDLNPHRAGFIYRGTVLLISMAAHGILSKSLYANPPGDTLQTQAENGGVLMFYAGDVVHAVVIFLFCRQWYKT
ncbi:cytochrome c oxidase assembly protein [Peribacillus sp. SCS-155]|uniref:cytochrome c oxidase assembly protein n=1 Tax=Peribacillus sedimenti TaxID=3115297 RepID=UPI003906B71A